MIIARGVLDELWIAGTLQTNERFLAELLAHPWVKAGHFHAGFVDEEFLPPVEPSVEVLKALIQVCEACPLAVPLDEGPAPTPDQYRWAIADRWVRDPGGKGAPWLAPPKLFNLAAGAGVSGTVKLSDGMTVRAAAFPLGPDRWQARVGAWAITVRRGLKRPSAVAKAQGPRVLALVPGRVHSVLFRKGALVPAHEVFLIIESLGMLVPHALSKEARVRRWKVAAEDMVSAGQELAEFEIPEGS